LYSSLDFAGKIRRMRNAYIVLVGTSEGKRPFGRPRYRQEKY
jgi:hypothetical protein